MTEVRDQKSAVRKTLPLGPLLLALSFLSSLLLSPCAAVDAQQPTKVPRIGYLLSGNSSSESERFESLRLALRELGYIEGQNVAVEYRYAGEFDRALS